MFTPAMAFETGSSRTVVCRAQPPGHGQTTGRIGAVQRTADRADESRADLIVGVQEHDTVCARSAGTGIASWANARNGT